MYKLIAVLILVFLGLIGCLDNSTQPKASITSDKMAIEVTNFRQETQSTIVDNQLVVEWQDAIITYTLTNNNSAKVSQYTVHATVKTTSGTNYKGTDTGFNIEPNESKSGTINVDINGKRRDTYTIDHIEVQ